MTSRCLLRIENNASREVFAGWDGAFRGGGVMRIASGPDPAIRDTTPDPRLRGGRRGLVVNRGGATFTNCSRSAHARVVDVHGHPPDREPVRPVGASPSRSWTRRRLRLTDAVVHVAGFFSLAVLGLGRRNRTLQNGREGTMYIGGGAVVLILIIVIVVLMMRR